jgi:dTDP-4-amino-4,6-dideoxygalactose transaminase
LIIAELDRRAAAGRRQPRAVIAVHILGMPARLDELAAACARHGVVLIEDAAEALGARYTQGPFAGKSVGTIGRIGAYSFNGNKIITSGGGGMITTADPDLAKRARHLTTQARLPGAEYRHDEVGYNYRLTNIAAALGLAQLEQLDDFLACKRAIADRYDDAFVDLPGFSRPQRVAWGESSHWLYAITVDDQRAGINREALATILSERSIDSRPIWTPLHLQAPYNQASRLGGAVAERLFRGGLCLPSSSGLTVAEQDRVIAAVRASTKGL